MSDQNRPDDLESRTDADVAGVQGEDGTGTADATTQPIPADTPDAPAPDAAEIEWAGGAITKPPRPDGGEA
jgi:hypothetical protein